MKFDFFMFHSGTIMGLLVKARNSVGGIYFYSISIYYTAIILVLSSPHFSKFILFLIFTIFRNIFRDLQNRIEKSSDGNLALPEFISFLKAFPKCLLPLNRYQHELRTKTLGES